jgi:endonuclease/exonuclease/phosphatase family metal-dependent hydrolase
MDDPAPGSEVTHVSGGQLHPPCQRRGAGTSLATGLSVRVLQLNLWGRREPYRERTDLLRRRVDELAPDVITLQEVIGDDAERNQAVELFGPLGFNVRFDPRPGRTDFEWGMAIAARHPIGPLEVIELEHGGVAIAARMTVADAAVWVCSACPLGWWQTQEVQREDECIALDAWLSALAIDDHLPPIIGGDFDATPDASSIRFMRGLQSLRGRSTHWLDTFALAGDGSPGYTFSSDNPFMGRGAVSTYADTNHRRRIDYVFVGSPFVWKGRITPTSASVVLKEEGGIAPSDHYGVMADLDVDGTAPALG